MPVVLDAPAKINLSLRVLRRREDGFHEITTRMAPLALADRVTLELLPDASPGTVAFTCDDPTVPGDGTNLAVRAVRALEKHTGPLPGLRIHLEKRIPHGAGLGGGSSDAAAVLRGAGMLFQIAPGVLQDAAAETGSDVPFFLYERACDCAGRGEAVTPVDDFTWQPRVLLLKPPFGVATPDAYGRWRDSREVPGFLYMEQHTPGGMLVNDLERPVFEKYPVLGLLKSRLFTCPGVQGALMSGSGSTVFAVLAPEADATAVTAAAAGIIGPGLWSCDTTVR